MNKITTIIIVCLFSMYAFSQNQASNWYFGYGGGIKFNLENNSISSSNDGKLFTNEGCATISDPLGNLLFYTDGTTVWNRNHEPMPNGLGLFGNSSSTQSAIIVPKPDDDTIYYIFTVDTSQFEDDPSDMGFNYSVVDMTLDGGLGDISQKNINLLEFCSEKLTAVVKDCQTKSVWVITFASENGTETIYNTFHSFEVNSMGVNITPVKSPISSLNALDRRGYIKASPDGTKLAVANVQDGLHLFDLDTSTGTVTNHNELSINNDNSPFPYGIEFSPNSELLYVHASNDFSDFFNPLPSNHSSVLIQYDLISSDIEASQVILDNRSLFRGALQLAPNGKIYRALSATYNEGSPYLGVINNPNNRGTTSNYQHNAVNLGVNNSSQGLPPFITSFFNEQIDIIQNGSSSTSLELCDNDTYILKAPKIEGASYTWYKDENLEPETSNILEISSSGQYKVIVNSNTGDCEDNLEGFALVSYNPKPIALNYTLIQCDDETQDGITSFNLNEADIHLTGGISNLKTRFYTDNNRQNLITDSNNFSNTSNNQIVHVEVYDENTKCFEVSELTLTVSATQTTNTKIEVCDDDGNEDGYFLFNLTEANNDINSGQPTGLNITYYASYEDASLERNSLGNSFTNKEKDYQIIYARAENNNNCVGISEVELIVNKLPDIETTAITEYYCLNTYPLTITINAGLSSGNIDNYTYAWSTGESSYVIEINEAKDYVVTITNKITQCSKDKIITVKPSNIASFNTPPFSSNAPTNNNIITVLVSGEGEYEYQLLDEENNIYRSYQTSNTFENVYPGIYSVNVNDTKNNCGEALETVYVIGFPKHFTPNNDGFYDTWQISGVSRMFQPNTKIQIFDRYGKLVKELSPLGKGWDGLINGVRLPTDDYWFKVTLQDGRIFRDHFTLKY